MANNQLPEHAIRVNNYQEFRDDLKVFGEGKYDSMIVIGGTGLGKTGTAKEVLGGNCLEVTGSPTSWWLYQQLHDHRDAFVIFDDVSQRFYRNEGSLTYLKQLLETRKEKTLRWPTTSAGNGKDYPNEFTTTSRALILTNEWSTLNEHVRAVEGRAFVMKFDPTPAEVHAEVARRGWFDDQEVFEFVWEHRRFITRPDMRLYLKISEQRKAGRPWRKRGIEMLVGPNSRLNQLAEILLDEKYSSNNQRWKEFERRGYGKRTLFYELLHEFRFYQIEDPASPPPRLAARDAVAKGR